MLHLIGAIERPDSGTIVSGGQQVTALHGGALAAYRRTVGFAFQRFNLLPALTVLDNVIAPVLPYRTAFNKRERARALLAAIGLAGREHSLPADVRSGNRRLRARASRTSDPGGGTIDPGAACREHRVMTNASRRPGIAMVGRAVPAAGPGGRFAMRQFRADTESVEAENDVVSCVIR